MVNFSDIEELIYKLRSQAKEIDDPIIKDIYENSAYIAYCRISDKVLPCWLDNHDGHYSYNYLKHIISISNQLSKYSTTIQYYCNKLLELGSSYYDAEYDVKHANYSIANNPDSKRKEGLKTKNKYLREYDKTLIEYLECILEHLQ